MNNNNLKWIILLKLHRLGKARQPCRQKYQNRTAHPRWFDKRVGPIIGRNVGEYNIIQKTETGGSYKYDNSIYKMKIQSA